MHDKINMELDNYFFKNDTLIIYLRLVKTFYKLKQLVSDRETKKLIDRLLVDLNLVLNNQTETYYSLKQVLDELNLNIINNKDDRLNDVYADLSQFLEMLFLNLRDNEMFAENSIYKYKLAKKEIRYQHPLDKKILEQNKEVIKNKQLVLQKKIQSND